MGLVGGVLGFGLGLAIGLAAAYLVYLRFFAAHHLQDPVIRPLRDLDSEALQRIIPDIPLWVKSPDYERVDWMNKFIFDMWPFLDKAICNNIKRATRQIFDQYAGQYGIESIEFAQLTLGALPPTFQGVKVYEMQEKELVIEPVIRWASTANVIVKAKVHYFEVSAQLVDLHIMITPRVTLKPLVPSFPCFANLCVSLMEKPHIDFGFKLLGGDVMAIPGLYRFVQDQISKQISILYHWPKVIQIPILDGASGATKKPVGILHVKVIRAMNLLKMDLLGKSDPYVKMRLSGERLSSKKTSVKMSNLNPEWNEHFRFIVKDPETQVLELHMFDWEKVKMHDKLGLQVIPLRLLTPYESKLFTLDLLKSMNSNDPHNKKNRGKLIVELTFDPFREDNSRTSLTSDGEGNASVRRDISSNGGVLVVSVENAEDVEGKRHTNPYAEVLFRGERKKTKVIRKTRDPRWSEEFQFMLDEPPVDDKIRIEVQSKRRGLRFRDKESLGHVDINLADVVNNGRINEKYHLINSRNGALHVEIKWNTV
ncbi:synaptotagmin-3-like isoform X1 [Phragmites australis]|uniref:synaptotagmin-3-like isoform X1 n=2 Tax=Phragmites australis TaxID=29695 RepID=UPI002D785A80|nr:synaptotagmin-3-like isoform X1 [Phragmites australis]